MKRYDRAMMWFRRDLRSEDNAALYRALSEARGVYCVFVFDTEILDALPRKNDRRVEFILASLNELRSRLQAMGGSLHILQGRAREEIIDFARRNAIQAVYANHDYEPMALARDRDIASFLASDQKNFHTCKDQVIFEKSEILTQEGTPYVVFTPYKRAWLARLGPDQVQSFAVDQKSEALTAGDAPALPTLASIGFEKTDLETLGIPVGMSGARKLLEHFQQKIGMYGQQRDFPAVAGSSGLSIHLRFGTISIRELVRAALNVAAAEAEGARIWLSELVWRDFYFSILHHFPHVIEGAFRRDYDRLDFENNETYFESWCAGFTGYPIVDAGMRQLNSTGNMHNRLRMICASFLVKDLNVDWRWGERYFADNLNDFDLSANNGGWQWCASTGCDAQPYFRIFNPVTQSKKFDPGGRFIRSLLPELGSLPERFVHEPWAMMPPEIQSSLGFRAGLDYPAPLVDHAEARKKTLRMYASIRPKGKSATVT